MVAATTRKTPIAKANRLLIVEPPRPWLRKTARSDIGGILRSANGCSGSGFETSPLEEGRAGPPCQSYAWPLRPPLGICVEQHPRRQIPAKPAREARISAQMGANPELNAERA